MATQAKLIGLVGVLVAGFFLLAGGASSASAHPGHEHAAPPAPATYSPVQISAPSAVVAPTEREDGQRQRTGRVDVKIPSGKAPLPVHLGNCCCGSFACHAGLEAAAQGVIHRHRVGERVRVLPVLAMAKAAQDGIERPPRGLRPL